MKILTSKECRAIVNAVTDNALIAQQNVLYRDLDPKELGIITDRIADNTLPILARIGKQCDLTNLMTAIGDMGTAQKNVNEWRKKRYGWHPSSDASALQDHHRLLRYGQAHIGNRLECRAHPAGIRGMALNQEH